LNRIDDKSYTDYLLDSQNVSNYKFIYDS